jgi:N-acetylmuramoyl-L-alanine amidase
MWLEDAKQYPLKNFYSGRPAPPDTIVLHWSAGGGEPDDVARYLATKRASYHLVIGRDGALAQLVSLDDTAWHAGDGKAWTKLPSVNRRSVGVCLCNRGPVSEAWATAHPDCVWLGEHHKAGFRSWERFERYTAEQRAALVALLTDLKARLPSLLYVTGHEDLTGGKGDPGPCLPLLDIDWTALGLTYRRHDWRSDTWSER